MKKEKSAKYRAGKSNTLHIGCRTWSGMPAEPYRPLTPEHTHSYYLFLEGKYFRLYKPKKNINKFNKNVNQNLLDCLASLNVSKFIYLFIFVSNFKKSMLKSSIISEQNLLPVFRVHTLNFFWHEFIRKTFLNWSKWNHIDLENRI